MLIKIRYQKTITYEAFVEVPSGLSREETFSQAMRRSDKDDLWREVDSDESELEIVAEYGKIPIVREDKDLGPV